MYKFSHIFVLLTRNAYSTKHGIAICPSVTLEYRNRIGWVTLKIVLIIRLGYSLFGAPRSASSLRRITQTSCGVFLSSKPSMCLKRDKIERRLLLIANDLLSAHMMRTKQHNRKLLHALLIDNEINDLQ